jgi:sugar O-acyltransferase (sialic acid O-acetyltransferase NeuD family)
VKKIIIIGASGFGREIAWLLERINKTSKEWNLLGFVDDDNNLTGKIINGYPVLGNCNWLNNQEENIYAVCAVGAAQVRKKIITNLKNRKFATLVDPSVDISKSVELGEGSIICASSLLTVNIELGKHVIINLDCTIGHDVRIKDFCTIYPSVNVSGNILLNECVEIGTGTQIIQGLEIGSNTIVGAGATVVKNLPSNCTAVGCPAKPIKGIFK